MTDDRAVAFRCSEDEKAWRWLKLPASHGAKAQALNYFLAVEGDEARGRSPGDKWTALTRVVWTVFGENEAAQPHHGLMAPPENEASPNYRIAVFSSDGALLYRFTGEGVVFANRDFKAWRAENRNRVLAIPAQAAFDYARPAQVGARSAIESLVSQIDDAGAAQALVTKHNGFPPDHPYHDGSGDHVNANHLVDAAQQVAHQSRARSGASLLLRGGEARFRRYVELERPFVIQPRPDRSTGDRLTFDIAQGGEPCARITLNYAP